MTRLSLPEYRPIEMYTRKTSVAIDGNGDDGEMHAAVAGLSNTFTKLDAALGEPVGWDVMAAWRKYQNLPRPDGIAKLTAEIYRSLRIVHAATTHSTGWTELRNGLIKATATVDQTSLSIRITRIGMTLIQSFVAYRLGYEGQPYPDAYVEAMLRRYWADIAAEIHWYHDEGNVPFQFKDEIGLNRHFRFDCDNPKIVITDGQCRFVIGGHHRDPRRYPIDFFTVLDGVLHIVPVEALTGDRLPLIDLRRWRARTPTLPPHFRLRFVRETMTPELPMT